MPRADTFTLNQGRNSEMSRTTVATPVILSAWDHRAMSKLKGCCGALPEALDDPYPWAGEPSTRAPHRGHAADPSAIELPHCEQIICLPPELAGDHAPALPRLP